MKYDNCEYCGGRVKEQKVRVDHRWKGKLIVVDDTPIGVCGRCGERYYSASVMHRLDLMAKGEVGAVREIKVPLINYSKAVAA